MPSSNNDIDTDGGVHDLYKVLIRAKWAQHKTIFANSYKMKGKICRILEEPIISEDGEDVVQAVPSQGNPSSQGSLSSWK